ncbi:MAG: rhomboid family intramembrane serine protease [Candidatus Omnitrophica bacterium 4484_70.2]|nr:MAG: rhomboid family intramembrane serine protease [Candidatus Omnitrophica bacterium 4484_70.2]
MIPLRDNIPHRRTPIVTFIILLANILVFFYEISLGRDLKFFIYNYGFVPSRVFFSVGVENKIFPLFTSIFLHAGFWHLAGNCLYLWIFADNVEDRLGHFNFLVFYIMCGVLANLTHLFFNWGSEVPAVGASGAIAGVLGAYFLMFPRARVLTLIPFFFFWQMVEIPAFFFLGFWFLYQFLLGIGSLGFSSATGIAFWAHIGGFIAGIFLLSLFIKRRGYYLTL